MRFNASTFHHMYPTIVAAAVAFVAAMCLPASAHAQTVDSGSDGSDGPLTILGSAGTVVSFDPSQFQGSQVAANIFNFTTITVASGVTVRLGRDKISGPVIWLAQGDVDIEGTVDLSGGTGAGQTNNPFARVSAIPGAGGFPGGVGGNAVQVATSGGGPGSGDAGDSTAHNGGNGGAFSGNQFLIPLVGGSGGGGGVVAGSTSFGGGGGAGGGAILIASSTRIIVNGQIKANGGNGAVSTVGPGGAGSGGAIRLIATSITGSGTLNVSPGINCCGGQTLGPTPGYARLENYTGGFTGTVSGSKATSSPFPLLLPTVGPATARVLSIGGVPVNTNPNTFPDITINTTGPVDVVIQTRNVPTSATVKLTILDENGVADTVIQAPPLTNCDQNNICTTTAPVVFPFGASRGLTRVTWTQ